MINTRQAERPEPPVLIGGRRHLFVDDRLIDQLQHARLTLHEPVPGGTAIEIDRPWEGPANFGGVVIRHGGRFLLYYRAMTTAKGDNGVTAVAVSGDGVTWTKPALGLVGRAGRRDTNLIADDQGNALSLAVWLDTRPGVPENERIKGFFAETVGGEAVTPFEARQGPKHMVMFASADGFVFRKLERQPDFVSSLNNSFDGGNTLFWSEAEQQYVLYYRFMDTHRSMARAVSKDFLHWSEPVPMTYGDTPREHLYVNNTQAYFRAPDLYVAPAARFMEGRRAITLEQGEALGVRNVTGHCYGDDCSEGVLLTSRPGSTRYDRTFMESFVRPGPGIENWVSRTNYPLTGLFPCGPDRMMFWVSRHYVQPTWHIERLLLRLDGFASIRAPYAGGELLTKPLVFDGSSLEINYRTGAAGSVRAEIQDAAGKPIPGFAIDACPEIIGDEIARTVAWKDGGDVGRLAGQAVRLRFALKDADLYSFAFGVAGNA